jgi:sirohydrochlorin ferrochelatase
MSTTKFAVPKAPATKVSLAHAALVLCAHGQCGTSGITDAHVESLRKSGCFARVEGCCINGEPDLASTLCTIAQGEIFIVPLLMADGYTYGSVLPTLMPDCSPPGTRIHLCRPLGQTPGLAAVAIDWAADLCADRGWSCNETTVIVAAHGTPRSSASSEAAQRLTAAIDRSRRFLSSGTGFLEQSPILADVLRAIRPAPCVVIGYFMDRGIHAGKDIPWIIETSHPEAAYTGAIGCNEKVPELIVDLVRTEALKAS